MIALDAAAPDLPGRGNALVLLPGEHCKECIATMQCSTMMGEQMDGRPVYAWQARGCRRSHQR